MSKEKQKWSYECPTNAIADTGDYDSSVQFTNGRETLQSCRDEIEEDECKVFCELLNKMPDLWSHRTDASEFENSQLQKENKEMKVLLNKIRSRLLYSLDSDGEPKSSMSELMKMWENVNSSIGL